MYKHTLLLVAAICLGAFAIPFNTAQADAVSINESQKDTLKCDKVKNCYQVTTGTYSVSLKLSKGSTLSILDTLLKNTATVDEINTSPIKGNLGVFEFAESLSTAAKGKAKITPTSLQGTWVKSHSKCLKYNASGVCKSTKTIIDSTVKLNLNAKTGGLLTLTGQSGDEHGQKLYADKCRDNGLGLTSLQDNFVVIVADRMLSSPISVSCKVKKTSKTVKNIPFELTSITATAKLVQHSLPIVQTPSIRASSYTEFYLAPSPLGEPVSEGFQEFSSPSDAFVSLTLKDSFKKAEAKVKYADIDFIYYLLGSSTAVLTNSVTFNQNFGLSSETHEKYDLDWYSYSAFPVFFNVYSSRFYDANGSALYYSLSDEEFDSVKTQDQVNAVIHNSIDNAHATSSSELRINYNAGLGKTYSQPQLFGVTASTSNSTFSCLIKVFPDTDIYALRMHVKCG